jgi:hypothetical protein
MSLINEALKKAQRQRTLDAAPLSGAPSGVAAAAVTTHVAAASHRRSLAPLWFGLGLLALGVGATVLVMSFRFDPAPAAIPVAVTPAAAVVESPPVTPAPIQPVTPVVETPTAVVILPSFAPPAAPAPAPVPNATRPVASPPQPVAVAAPVTPQPPTQSAAAPAAPAATPVTPVADFAAEKAAYAAHAARVYEFLNTLRLTGVRGLGAEARVLMNERVWRLNDVVSPELGLRLSAVRPGLLVFTDASGRTYEKPH